MTCLTPYVRAFIRRQIRGADKLTERNLNIFGMRIVNSFPHIAVAKGSSSKVCWVPAAKSSDVAIGCEDEYGLLTQSTIVNGGVNHGI